MRRLRPQLRAAFVALTCTALGTALFAAGGAYKATKHGSRTEGVQRATDLPRGSCVNCHTGHTAEGNSPPSEKAALFAPNDNNLCFTCHLDASTLGSWSGSSRWSDSAHGRASSLVWPGPQPASRSSADSGKCINCHEPHGTKDRDGVVPSMLIAREETLCTRCHDGARATDVASQFRKTYTHPVLASARHDEAERDDSAKFGAGALNNRHSECADCHNVHVASRDTVQASAPDAPARISGVSRIAVANGMAGSKPVYTWKAPEENAFAREYELCFKCHSSWTRQPVGQEDLAALTNPANASYHPIQAAGKNRSIDPAAFANRFDSNSILYCTDCHASDDERSRGPHGSNHKYILKKETVDTPMSQTMRADNLCFDCHAFDVYANPASASNTQRASRFNQPSQQGHAFHVGALSIPCFSCHETHGSVRNPALISTSRVPGISSFMQTPAGGTCSTSCHQSRTYKVNYPR